MKINIFYNGNRLRRLKSPSGMYRMESLAKLENAIIWDISNKNIYESLKNIDFKADKNHLIIESSCCPCSSHNFPTFIETNEYNVLIQNFNKKIYLAEDIHDYTFSRFGNKDYGDLVDWLIKNKIDKIVSFVDNFEWKKIQEKTENQIQSNESIKFIIIPHHVNTELFKDYKLEKKWDVLLYGSRFGPYPFRARLASLLKNSDINCTILPSPVDFGRPSKSGVNLAKLINESWLAVGTGSKYDYLVCKYFEIAACNTLVIGNMPLSGKDIWKDNFVELNEKMKNDEIIDKIKKTLEDKKSLIEKSQKMYEIIQDEYNMKKYANKVLEALIS